jgi:hypothetical protein
LTPTAQFTTNAARLQEVRSRAVRLVCSHVENASQAIELLDALGLDPLEGTPNPPQEVVERASLVSGSRVLHGWNEPSHEPPGSRRGIAKNKK